jgi:hypothetical protein
MVTKPPTICSDGLIDIVGGCTVKVAGIGYVVPLYQYVYVKFVTTNVYVPYLVGVKLSSVCDSNSPVLFIGAVMFSTGWPL